MAVLDLVMVKDNAMVELLKWYLDAGVDCVLDNSACNRLIEKPVPYPSAQTTSHAKAVTDVKKRASTPELFSREASFQTARDSADNAASLDELKAAISRFEGCPLKFTAKNLVFGSGAVSADLMIIGEAPGHPGFFNAVTVNGVTLGPVIGLLTSEIIRNGRTNGFVNPFTLSRFA